LRINTLCYFLLRKEIAFVCSCHQSKQMIAETKLCLCCNHGIKGRSDKKFCNDFCRNAHHNKLKSTDNNYVRKVNHNLLRNRKILENLFTDPKQVIRTTRHKLQEQQFDFHYFTHQYNNRKGQKYFFCYEFGYRVLKDAVIVVRKKV
jgi:hypothetical protein